MRSVPKLVELSTKHADQGLVLIGVHSAKGGEAMATFVQERGITYPVAWDRTGATTAAYLVDGFPDYHVIDRSGNVRVADMANGELERVVKALLKEPVLDSVPAPLVDAAAEAKRKDTRILGVFSGGDGPDLVRGLTRKDRDLAELLRNEFQLVGVDASEQAELLAAAGVGAGVPSLVAFTAEGKALGSRPLAGLDGSELRSFLELHRIPARDAEALWSAARSRAQREDKRLLVHLGAPW